MLRKFDPWLIGWQIRGIVDHIKDSNPGMAFDLTKAADHLQSMPTRDGKWWLAMPENKIEEPK